MKDIFVTGVMRIKERKDEKDFINYAFTGYDNELSTREYFAGEKSDQDEIMNNYYQMRAKDLGIKVINDSTGESEDYVVKNLVEQTRRISSSESEKDVEITIEVPPATNGDKSGIKPQSSETGEVTNTITAKLTVTFDHNRPSGQDPKIRITKVTYSWSSLSQYITLSDRSSTVFNGSASTPKRINKYPTTNSGSYTTGWDYVYWEPEYGYISGPKAYSSVKYTMSGSLTRHTVYCEIQINRANYYYY